MAKQFMRAGVNGDGLRALVEFLPLKNAVMVEVGSWAGESAEIFAESGKFEKIICIDHWKQDDGEREWRFDEVRRRHGSITKIKGESIEEAGRFDGRFDFIYIDASHAYESIKADIEAWSKHLKPGGWIGGHDYSWKFPGVLQAVFEAFGKPHRVFQDSSWLVRS